MVPSYRIVGSAFFCFGMETEGELSYATQRRSTKT
jgi:hypothetical protein